MKALLTALCMFLFSSASAWAESGFISKISIPLFTQTSAVTVANTVAETTLLGTGVGVTTIPANFLIPGMTIKYWALGFRSVSGNPTEHIRIKVGGNTVLDTGAQVSGAGTNELWELRGVITILTTGVSGTAWAQGFYMEEAGTGGDDIFGMVNTSVVTINTTIALTGDITWQWGTASSSDTITMSNLLVEIAN